MAAGATDPHGEGTMGSVPSQGIFVGWLAIGLLALMLAFVIFLAAGAMMAR